MTTIREQTIARLRQGFRAASRAVIEDPRDDERVERMMRALDRVKRAMDTADAGELLELEEDARRSQEMRRAEIRSDGSALTDPVQEDKS